MPQEPALQQCLSFFREIVGAPDADQKWRRWWLDHRALVEAAFEPGDYELLRTGHRIAAVMVLRRGDFEKDLNCRFTTIFSSRAVAVADLAELPADYREFLLTYNGAYVQPGWIVCGAEERCILELLSIDSPGLISHAWSAAHPPKNVAPVALLNVPGTLVPGDDLLVIVGGAVQLWRCDGRHFHDRQLTPLASSFRELLRSLRYPTHGTPWMELIDKGDAAGFSSWLASGIANHDRDPASGMLPFEYLALSRDINAYVGQAWSTVDGRERAVARGAMAEALIERRAPTGMAFRYAVSVRKFALAERLLPISSDLTRQDLLDARSVLRSAPDQKGLLRSVERQLRNQNR